MNNKTRNSLIIVTVVLAGLYFAYKKFKSVSSDTAISPKDLVIAFLDKNYPTTSHTVHSDFINKSYSEDVRYVNSWAEAIKSGQDKFAYNGKYYWTLGGSAVR